MKCEQLNCILYQTRYMISVRQYPTQVERSGSRTHSYQVLLKQDPAQTINQTLLSCHK